MLLLAGLPAAAAAHHILGIPHYKYSTEYPQIPYLEILAQVGPHDLVFTHFPGFPEPGEAVRFKLYIRQRDGGRVFRQPLRLEVVRKHFLRRDEPVVQAFEIHPGRGPERNDYKFFLTFQEREAYELRLRFPAGDGFETIPFPVVIGKTDDRPLIFGAAGLLALAVVSVAVVKRHRRRRSARRRSPRARNTS